MGIRESMKTVLELADKIQERAREIIRDAGIKTIWSSINAEVYLVGSVETGLLMKHKDIDFHIYSDELNLQESFSVMAQLAENTNIKKIECVNLINTEEECIEWHAWYEDKNQELWQIDMIHIRCGSLFDGYAERLAERISEVLTSETRQAILQLKYDTPDDVKIPGVEYYMAVIRDGIRNYADFIGWRKNNPQTGIIHWIP